MDKKLKKYLRGIVIIFSGGAILIHSLENNHHDWVADITKKHVHHEIYNSLIFKTSYTETTSTAFSTTTTTTTI